MITVILPEWLVILIALDLVLYIANYAINIYGWILKRNIKKLKEDKDNEHY